MPPVRYLIFLLLLLNACAVSKINRSIRKLVHDPALANAQVGVSVRDLLNGRQIAGYQSEKYFIPASNVKIATLYASLRFLGERVPAMEYNDTADTLYIRGTGDPSFLHPAFTLQPAFDFLRANGKPLVIDTSNWRTQPWGHGWSWDDYEADYMAERSAWPIYGNLIQWTQMRDSSSIEAMAGDAAFIYSLPDVDWKVSFSNDTSIAQFQVRRSLDSNRFIIYQGKEGFAQIDIPFHTQGVKALMELLPDTLGRGIANARGINRWQNTDTLFSQSLDSVQQYMMWRSDNLFAEQSLLMISQKLFGHMNEKFVIDTLLNGEWKEMPQRPRWVDGSGLSRYNLFTPEDFTWILRSMASQFGMERLMKLFPGAGQGTLEGFFAGDSGRIFAKTGGMSNVVCLSGYLYSRRNRWIAFSVLINGHQSDAYLLRRKVETFVKTIRQSY